MEVCHCIQLANLYNSMARENKLGFLSARAESWILNYCLNIKKYIQSDKSKAQKLWFDVSSNDVNSIDQIESLKYFVNGSMGIVKYLNFTNFNFINYENAREKLESQYSEKIKV